MPLRTIMNVVLVEDSLLIATQLIEKLQAQPNVSRVDHAVDEDSALALIQQIGADVIILDLGLGRGSGLGVLSRLCKARSGATVLVLTNHTHQAIRSACLDAGARHFFDKHTQADACISAVAALGGRHGHV
jgi:DNA-binding NarL/FixJ family response regulator